MRNKKIIIICPKQFGYLSDYYYYCLYLDKYIIDFICLDQNLKKISPPKNTTIHYLSPKKFRLSAIAKTRELDPTKSSILFVYYHKFCFAIPVLQNRYSKTILDIRTGNITKNKIKLKVLNNLLRFETIFFKKITIISFSLSKLLKINSNKIKVVPLGAEILGFSNRSFNELNLLYVGTFHNRNIPLTIEGTIDFMEKHPEIKVSYTIVGFGSESDVISIQNAINKNKQHLNQITYSGRKHHSELKDIFEFNNIGISFIPKIQCFENQPPTKTFEYIRSGMVCLATSTKENKKIINTENGVLINDTKADFTEGLKMIWDNRNNYNSNEISKSSEIHSWKNVVSNYLLKVLNSF